MYITTIWYRIATSGDTPARINPVIAPGRLINPTTLVEIQRRNQRRPQQLPPMRRRRQQWH